ncbi:DNA primase [Flindersiella endophytica]
MAGRIRDEDIALVRERTRIDEVVSQYVTLRPAGSGSLKGLCPFHDEKSPSFNVRPHLGHCHCFGCSAGGDVIWFLQEIEGITFIEAVERLAERAGVQLRYVDGGGKAGRSNLERGQRSKLVEAHRLAAEYYSEQLNTSPEAAKGRTFLSERGFDRAAAEMFSVGYAPRGPSALLNHLRGKGFKDEDLVAGGLVAEGQRGRYDRFRGRLIWPIRELSGDVVGFGARRLYDDDRVEAKYLNTPESPIYHKSQLLYGVDLARREIARQSQAVVVEGYTDVMACHLAGVPTAVATCGTAFGEDHVRVLRRLLLDHDEFRGDVIFTFDGDEAGQRAALKAFEGDQQFVSQTYVAVEPDGLDPCDLRLSKGDAAVRDLIARRVPLYEFVLRNVLSRYDLNRADARIDALRSAAPLVAAVRDRSKVGAYARELAGMLGMDIEEVRAEVGRVLQSGQRPAQQQQQGRRQQQQRPQVPGQLAALPAGIPLPPPNDPRLSVERELLKLVIQAPAMAGPAFDALEDGDFTHPAYLAIRTAATASGGVGTAPGGDGWVSKLREHAADDAIRGLITALAVEPLHSVGATTERYGTSLLARIQELAAARRINEIKSRLQRLNPVQNEDEHMRLFAELIALEQHRQALRNRAAGSLE